MSSAGRLWLVALAALVLPACGGGGGKRSSGGAGTATVNGGGGVNGISVANCLNEENFLVSPSQTTIDGTSPGGVSFTLVFYANTGAAKTAFVRKNKKTTGLVENAVVNFKGNPTGVAGAPPAKISPTEVALIRKCIDANKK